MAKKTRLVEGWRLVRDATAKLPWDANVAVLRNGKAVYDLIRPLARLEEAEVVWALPLDSGLRLLVPGPIVVMRGHPEKCDVHVGACFRVPLQVGAVGLIVAHNHTNGLARPSPADRSFTRRLRAAGELLGCPLLDHVIVGVNGFYSFGEP